MYKRQIHNGLLQKQHIGRILEHARETDVEPSDAALALSMLELYEVDAISLLCRPAELSPGYVLTNLIGCGAGGMVFRARQTALGRDVALKTIHVRSRNASTPGQLRIQREAHAIARLHHPNIVTAHDSGFHQGRFFIAMELVEGETLADFIVRQSPVPENVAWHIVRQVASALSHANEAGITHRDIKPSNLLLCEPPSGTELLPGVPFVKVADFGLAFEFEEQGASQITATGITLGTPAYVAPEQLQDTRVDARADIYSLGATVYHMLTGCPPGAEQSAMRMILQKTVGDDGWREEVPIEGSEGTIGLFRDMTESNIEDRIGGYRELISRIDELLDGTERPLEKIASVPLSAGDGAPSPTHTKRTSAVIVTILMVIGLGAVFARWGHPSNMAPRSSTSTVLWKVDGFPQPLFNGKGVPLFRQSGSWSPGVEQDGSRVLIGREGSQMTIPLAIQGDPSTNMRLRVGVRSTVGSVVELALRQSDENADCGLLRIQDNAIEFSGCLLYTSPSPRD